MTTEKAAIFIDNSNIFKGMHNFSKKLTKESLLEEGEFLRIKWEKLIDMLESQNGGIDIYARHFFASLPPAADVRDLNKRPSEEQWEQMVKKSAQSGFYKVIQDPPFNFTLHAVPLRFAEVRCGSKMRQAYFKCLGSYTGNIECNLSVDPDECYKCKKKFILKYEKGVDVALAAHLVIFGGTRERALDRIILVAGDGDYKEALRYIRQEIGKDVQIVSWRRALSNELEKISNKPTVFLDNYWEDLCEIRRKPPLEETPAIDEESDEDQQ